MTDTSIQRRYSDILQRVRQPARLIGNECGAGPGFTGVPEELRVVLAFPDAYEIGISNQAIQILYHSAKEIDGVGVERAYLPWVDAIGEMRSAGVPLLTIETWSPVATADLFGVTLQHEFNYTNVLEMLDLAGIPLRAAGREEGQPLVVGGGPAVANFLPLAPFLDAVVIGDGEETFPEILHVLTECKRAGLARMQTKQILSAVPGVFVPGENTTVTRRVLQRLEDASYPTSGLVALTAGIHDRAWVEVMRGCSRGCRFCQAGIWYRPVRERSPEKVLEMACAQLEATGHEELALASLSTTDYSALGEVLAGLAAARPESRVSLPSLRVDSAAVRLAHLVSPTGPSLTLAPEAGSQRMRDLINKNVTEDDILTAVGEAFSCGYTTLKLYFIIGLPLEDDEDVEAIADLCLRIRELGRRTLGHRAGRLQMSVSINNFVPKPFTPFQWQGMTDRATIRRRQEILRGRLRKPGIRVALHDVDKSYLEAALARGDEDMSGVIERAWRGGARFDSWTEQFRGAAWREALESAGTTAEALATRSFDRDARLPWDTIAGVATKEFLWEEWERATRAETTPDCRHEECRNCGACFAGGRVDLARAGQGPAEAPTLPVSAVAAAPVPTAAASGGRYLLTFSVSGRARFVGHLDKMELFRRAVRRAGGRLALSAGLRPKALLSLAIPLGVGMEADAEICEFELAVPPPVDFVERLNQALPPGLRVISVEPYAAARHAAARVVAAEYEVVVEEAGEAAASKERTASQEALPVPTRVPALGSALRLGAQRFAVASVLEREELREDRLRAFDVKEYVKAVEVATEADGSVTLRFRIAMTPTGSVRPERVVITLGELAGVSLNVCRAVRKRIVLS